jgi:hypothetical protein
MISLFPLTASYLEGSNSWNTGFAFAQLTNNNIIQIVSTSTFTDDFGNFHVIGEVNNTSIDPQTNIIITALLSDTNNNVLVGNHSAFSSISTLRQTELSPFDIVIQDPQILGKFNFMEFSTTSQPAIEKPANLVLNGTSAFLDNIGNPHITGNIINQGQSPEQFLNLVATFYDNSSLGVVGTQSFGLNVGNLSQNQMTPFDITIFDNKTKSQGKFYSLNMDSTQSSMTFPTNTKFLFNNDGFGGGGGGGVGTEFIDSGGSLFTTPPPLSDNQGFVNDDNTGQSSSSRSSYGNSGSSSGNDLEIDIDVAENRISPGSDQTYEVTVSDADTEDKIAGAIVDGKVKYATGDFDNKGRFDNEVSDDDGKVKHTWQIGGNTREGTLNVIVNVVADGYNSATGSTTFEVIKNLDDTNGTASQDNSTDTEDNNNTLTNDNPGENDDDLDCRDIGDTDIPVGSDDPNNLDADADGIGCESGDNITDENVGSSQHESGSEETGSANADSSDSTTNGDDANDEGSENDDVTSGDTDTTENDEDNADDTGSIENNGDNEDNNEEPNDNSEDN